MVIPGKCDTQSCEFDPISVSGKGRRGSCCLCNITFSSRTTPDPFSRNISECHYASSAANCELAIVNVRACWLNPADNSLWYTEPRLLVLRIICYLVVALIAVFLCGYVLRKTDVVPDRLLPLYMQAELMFGVHNPVAEPEDEYRPLPTQVDALAKTFADEQFTMSGDDDDESVSFLSTSNISLGTGQ